MRTMVSYTSGYVVLVGEVKALVCMSYMRWMESTKKAEHHLCQEMATPRLTKPRWHKEHIPRTI